MAVGVRNETSARHSERVRQALAFVAARLAAPDGVPTLEELSRRTSTAPFYLHRIFREATGEPLQTYIRRLRLEYAAYRLLVTDLPVLGIAVDAGYESNAAFTRAFKRWLGTPPATFRTAPGTARGDKPRYGQQPSRVLAVIPYAGDPAGTHRAWRELADLLTRHGIDPAATPALGILPDGPEPWLAGGPVRYEAAAVLDRPLPGVPTRVLPATRTAAVPHTGPPELLACSYVRLVLRVAIDRGVPPLSPGYEVHRRVPDGPVAAPEVRIDLPAGLS
jgi:AraC family transcriptional regulator